MFEDAVDKDHFNVVIGTDDAIQKTDILINVRDMLVILHADDADPITQLVHEPVVFIDKDDTACRCLDCFVGQLQHLVGFPASFMSDQ